MSTMIGALAMKISASVAGLKAELDKGLGHVGAFVRSANGVLRNTFSGLGGIANNLVGGGNPFQMIYSGAKNLAANIPLVGGFFAAGVEFAESFTEKLRETIKEMVEIKKESLKLGTDVESMGALLYMAGGDSEVLFKGLEKLQHKLGDAATGGKETGVMFRKLGFDAKELGDMPLIPKLELIADKFNSIQSPVQRAHMLFELFGKSGAEMAPLLARGRAGMEAMIQKAHDLGITFNDDVAQQAMAAAKGLKEFDGLMKGIWMQIATQALPLLRGLQEEFKGAGITAKEVASKIFDAGKWIVMAGADAIDIWERFNGVLNLIKAGINGMAVIMLSLMRNLLGVWQEVAELMPGEEGTVKDIANAIRGLEDLRRDMNENMMNNSDKALRQLGGIDKEKLLKDMDALRDKLIAAAAKKPIVGGDTDLAALSNLIEQMDKWAERLKGLRSPFEKWKEDMAELNQALAIGAVTRAQYVQLAGKMTEELVKQSNIAKNAPPAMLLEGSAAEFTARHAMNNESATPLDALKAIQKNEEEIKKNTKRAADAAEKMTRRGWFIVRSA